MTPEQVFEVSRLSKLFPKTGRAFRIVAALDAFYESLDMDEAERSFKALCSWMRRSRLRPMKEAALTLIRHQTKILAYFKQRLTNAICEGINSLVQTAKRKACGCRTFKGFASMIYLVAGKLTLATPQSILTFSTKLEVAFFFPDDEEKTRAGRTSRRPRGCACGWCSRTC